MILVYSYFPLFDKHLAGGMQAWSRGLLGSLTKRGLDIQLVCPNSKLHSFPKDIKVHHILDDLEIDGLTPKRYYKNIQALKELEKKADVIWTFDRPFPLKSNKKKVLSLGTFCYEREMKAIFQDDYDKVVVPTNYTRQQFVFYRKNIDVIPMFVESNLKKVKPNFNILKKYFNYDENKKYLLFPHRPEISKGHYDAVSILEQLLIKDSSYMLLIPKAPNSRLADVVAENEFIEQLMIYVESKGLKNNIIFHNWVDSKDMAEYLSIGSYALFFTKLPETFGISLINCIACGTPVISYGSGALKEVVPNGLGHYIIKDQDYTAAVDKILEGKNEKEIKRGLNYLKKYKKEKIVDSYYNILFKLENDYRGEYE